MLVTIPIGLWIFSLVCDFVAMRSGAPATWAAASYYAMVGGIIGALAAAVPGLIDLLSLRNTPIQPTALKHMGLNLAIVALYVVNAWLRRDGAAAAGTPLLLSVVAIAMLLVSGWLGGKMVYEAGVAVHADEAGPARPRPAGLAGAQRRSAGGRTGRRRSANPERATASDSTRPSRDAGRADKPSASRIGRQPARVEAGRFSGLLRRAPGAAGRRCGGSPTGGIPRAPAGPHPTR